MTDQFFSVLGTAPAVGQLPSTGSTADVVIGQRVAHQILSGATSDIVGAPLSLSEEPRAIGAVMPSDFAFPDDETGLWLPHLA